jgi:hypothetical protein
MTEPMIWLHEDALRITHPVMKAAPAGTRIMHIWDDAYLQSAGYSLKRLLFIYETLCELPLEIVRGDTVEVLSGSHIGDIYVPSTTNPKFQKIIDTVSREKQVTIVKEKPFVYITSHKDFSRFFQYWGKAEKTAFLTNGGVDV